MVDLRFTLGAAAGAAGVLMLQACEAQYAWIATAGLH